MIIENRRDQLPQSYGKWNSIEMRVPLKEQNHWSLL